MFTEASLWKSIKEFSAVEIFMKDYYEKYHQHCPLEYYIRKESAELPAEAVPFLPSSNPAELPESQYFQNALQIKIVQHIRYMHSPDHTHAFYEMIYVMTGECFNVVDGQPLPLKQGDICLIPPKVGHSITVNSDSIVLNILLRSSTFTSTFSSLLKDVRFLSDFFNEIIYSNTYKKYLLFHTQEDELLRHMVLEMFTEQENRLPFYESILNGQLIAFLGKLLQRHENSMEYPSEYMKRFSNVPQITSYIRQYYSTVTLNSCAAFFHFNPQYLSTLLKKNTGKSFSALLTDARMEHAAALLSESPVSVRELSEILGYSDPAYFMKVFKKYFGCTPSVYRHTDI